MDNKNVFLQNEMNNIKNNILINNKKLTECKNILKKILLIDGEEIGNETLNIIINRNNECILNINNIINNL